MALRNITLEGDSVLRKKCREVTEVTDRIRILIDDMVETMRNADGVGLAAPQVGVLRRVVVVETEELYEMVNPVITKMEGEQYFEEACLSVPGKAGRVRRPEKVTCECLDRYGNKQVYEVEGLTAVAFCHECDHLDGTLFIDKADGIRSTENDVYEEEE
ncbi:MAG: peptide deformylase [Clostridia bacterium]|nr:peptide deformylase [Clostridia bacterium]